MIYYIRLDDACEKMDIQKWNQIEDILNENRVKPLVGVIPFCQDPMMEKYQIDPYFWEKVKKWENNGWKIALHGFNHVYLTKDGGLNPINYQSEFAGVPFEIQEQKIKEGLKILKNHEINPCVFFAPSHTFDENTIKAIKANSDIRIISDTIANKPYNKHGITFIPQQSGVVRQLLLNTVTFCYHPNTMTDYDFKQLKCFIQKHRNRFQDFEATQSDRRLGFLDYFLRLIYFSKKRIIH